MLIAINVNILFVNSFPYQNRISRGFYLKEISRLAFKSWFETFVNQLRRFQLRIHWLCWLCWVYPIHFITTLNWKPRLSKESSVYNSVMYYILPVHLQIWTKAQRAWAEPCNLQQQQTWYTRWDLCIVAAQTLTKNASTPLAYNLVSCDCDNG